MKWYIKRAVSFLLAVVLVFTLPQYSAKTNAATLPRPTDSYTLDGMLALLKTYNPDAYYFVSTEIYEYNKDPSFWFIGSNDIISGLSSAVHETFHQYSYDNSGSIFGRSENIYAGDNLSYMLDYNNIPLFNSSEAFDDLDPSLRTERFETYVGKSSMTNANRDGTYGLLNEFSAYYWGLNIMTSLMDYYKEYDTDNTAWEEYASSLANGMNAYAEFRYWILSYMLYAKDEHPKTYKAILNDKEFCTAFSEMDDKFALLISDNLGANTSFNAFLADRRCCITASLGGIFFYNGDTYSGSRLDAYYTLMPLMKSDSPYYDIYKTIKKHAGSSGTPMNNYASGIKKPSKPAWTNIERQSNGISLKWKKSSGATGYYIYRSINGSTFKKVKTIKSASKTSWTDDNATDTGSIYSYKIKAYTKKKNKTATSNFSYMLTS